jgi:hypothetical protein
MAWKAVILVRALDYDPEESNTGTSGITESGIDTAGYLTIGVCSVVALATAASYAGNIIGLFFEDFGYVQSRAVYPTSLPNMELVMNARRFKYHHFTISSARPGTLVSQSFTRRRCY